jgi:DNA-binding NarL/FixJ family response regulator
MDIQRTVLVVEDEPLLRQLLAERLSVAGFNVASAANVAEARKVANDADPDLALIDIDLGDGPNGIDLAKILEDSDKGIAIVFLTHIADPRLLGISKNQMPKNYAYLLKSKMSDPKSLVQVIEKVLRDEVSPSIQENLNPNHPFTTLSRPQLEVLKLLATGLTATQIAEQRGTTPRAVRNIISRACTAAGIDATDSVNNRLLAIREYIRFAGIPSGR